MSLLDLLQPESAAGRSCANCGDNRGLVAVPVLEGWLGPGLPLAVTVSAVDRHPFPGASLASVERPLVARLTADPGMAVVLGEADLALLDQSAAGRTHLRKGSLYLVNRRGEGLIRYVTLERDDLLVLRGSAERPEALPLGQSHLLDVVRARVAWILRSFDLR